MDISFQNKKLAKQFNEGVTLDREHGTKRAKLIRRRMAALRAAKSLKDFWPPYNKPERCHVLNQGKRKRHLSMDLDHPYRLIFTLDHDPHPLLSDGGLDWGAVTCIKILGVEDTHE